MRKASPGPALKVPRQPTPVEQIPRVVLEPTLDDHLEILAQAIFQAGLSWAMIAARWDHYQIAFDRFSAVRVAQYDAFDIERLMATDRIVHSLKKIEGIIANARTLLALNAEYGSIALYARRFTSYTDLFDDARGRFAFLGDLNCYYWLFRTNNPVPLFENWIARQPKDHPRVREMVMAGRALATSSELREF